MQASHDHSESIAEALEHMHPELAAVREAGGDPVYLVGGAVRDLLLGRGRADIDLVVEGDAAALAERLGAEVTAHERFGTAKVKLNGHEVDIAGARSESYPQPGALPVVERGADLAADLRRRDFTINAMAIPLRGEPRLIDPHGGEADLAMRQLRVLHDGSFVDDPTRALRAARYAARFGFGLEARHRRADPRDGPERRSRPTAARRSCCASPPKRMPPSGFALLAEWGLLELRAERSRAGRRGRRSCSTAIPGATQLPAIAPCSPRRWARRAARRPWPGGARSVPRRRSRLRLPTTASSLCSPAPSAPSGSIATSESGATWRWRSTAQT